MLPEMCVELSPDVGLAVNALQALLVGLVALQAFPVGLAALQLRDIRLACSCHRRHLGYDAIHSAR